MTALTQATAVLEGLAGKTLTNARKLQIVTDYNGPDAGTLSGGVLTPFTSEEAAQAFLDDMLARAKHKVKSGAVRTAQEANESVVQAASDASVLDL